MTIMQIQEAFTAWQHDPSPERLDALKELCRIVVKEHSDRGAAYFAAESEAMRAAEEAAERAVRAARVFGELEIVRMYVGDVLDKAGVPLVCGRME